MSITLRTVFLAGVVVLASPFAQSALAATDDSAGSNHVMTKPRPAEGVEERKPSIGAFAGIAQTEGRHRDGVSYGAEFGYQPVIPFGLAVELSGYVSDRGDENATLTRTRLLVKGNYNLGGTTPVIKDSYVGLGIGPVVDHVQQTNDVELGIAPQIGFDIPVGPQGEQKASLGANANYMFVGGARPDVFALNGVVKYWF